MPSDRPASACGAGSEPAAWPGDLGHALHRHAGVRGAAADPLRPAPDPAVAPDRAGRRLAGDEHPEPRAHAAVALWRCFDLDRPGHRRHALRRHGGHAQQRQPVLRPLTDGAVGAGGDRLQPGGAAAVPSPARRQRHVPPVAQVRQQPGAGRCHRAHALHRHLGHDPGAARRQPARPRHIRRAFCNWA